MKNIFLILLKKIIKILLALQGLTHPASNFRASRGDLIRIPISVARDSIFKDQIVETNKYFMSLVILACEY